MMTKLGPSNGIMTGFSGKTGQLCGSRKLACSQTSTALTHLLATEELLDLFLGPLESNFRIWPKKSTYSDIFLRTAPHHASQTFPDWETSFKAPAQMQGAEICIYIRGLNCKITIGWCVYQSKNSV